MSSVESTELKLKTTPTGGIDASHSPYYRRLLSAGYKGELQGAIGGGSLYGTIGLVIGAIIAVPMLFMTGLPLYAPLLLVGFTAGTGALVGADTFGKIGSTAAINAETADLAEQRRYLLDRYNDLPSGPEGDHEAAEIRKQLVNLQGDNGKRPALFHWKTVAICATAGAVIALALFSPLAAPLLLHAGIFGSIHAAIVAAVGSTAAASVVGSVIGASLGALTGAAVGIDRYYVRKWFDVTEGVVHSSSHKETALVERNGQVERLKLAAHQDSIVKENLSSQHAAMATAATASAASPAQLNTTEAAIPVKPDTKVTQAMVQDRLASLQRTMDVAL